MPNLIGLTEDAGPRRDRRRRAQRSATVDLRGQLRRCPRDEVISQDPEPRHLRRPGQRRSTSWCPAASRRCRCRRWSGMTRTRARQTARERPELQRRARGGGVRRAGGPGGARPTRRPASRCPRARPSPSTTATVPRQVPNVVGKQQDDADQRSWRTPGSPEGVPERRPDRPSRPGTVLEQSPTAGTEQPTRARRSCSIVSTYVAPTESPSAADRVDVADPAVRRPSPTSRRAAAAGGQRSAGRVA